MLFYAFFLLGITTPFHHFFVLDFDAERTRYVLESFGSPRMKLLHSCIRSAFECGAENVVEQSMLNYANHPDRHNLPVQTRREFFGETVAPFHLIIAFLAMNKNVVDGDDQPFPKGAAFIDEVVDLIDAWWFVNQHLKLTLKFTSDRNVRRSDFTYLDFCARRGEFRRIFHLRMQSVRKYWKNR